MKVIYFDGVCGLCNGFVDFVLSADKKNQFHFSPLQSEHAKASLPPEYTRELKSVVLQLDGKVYQKSEAALMVLKLLGPPWSALAVFRHLPQSLTNFGYDLVAKHRYRLFGKRETCRLPSPEERTKFIL